MSDLVERLRNIWRFGIYKVPNPHETAKEAADEIERLTAELSQFDDLQLCDCCGGLFETVHDADGHMQCDTCTRGERA